MNVCPFCGEPVDPQSRRTALKMTAVNSKTGEIIEPEPTGPIAHSRCVAAAQLGAPHEPPPSD